MGIAGRPVPGPVQWARAGGAQHSGGRALDETAQARLNLATLPIRDGMARGAAPGEGDPPKTVAAGLVAVYNRALLTGACSLVGGRVYVKSAAISATVPRSGLVPSGRCFPKRYWDHKRLNDAAEDRDANQRSQIG